MKQKTNNNMNEDFASLGSTPGMGNVTPASAPSGSSSFYSGSVGSGDTFSGFDAKLKKRKKKRKPKVVYETKNLFDIKEIFIKFLETELEINYKKLENFSKENDVELKFVVNLALKILTDFFQHGHYQESIKKGKEIDFDRKQLEIGLQWEFEHTNDEYMAERIAKDHLCESKFYYKYMKEMIDKYQNN